MSKLYVVPVVLALLALAAVPALGMDSETGTFYVKANVPEVFIFTVTDDTIDFGDLSTGPLTNSTYDELGWLESGSDILQWTLSTNCDVAVVVAGAGNMSTTADFRCAPVKGGIYSTVPNNEIETLYKMDPAVSFYDNGVLDGPYDHGGSWANQSVGWQTWLAPGDTPDFNQRWGSFNSGNATITGGFDLEMNMNAKIRPKGLGQQPGAYNSTFTVTVYNRQGIMAQTPPLEN